MKKLTHVIPTLLILITAGCASVSMVESWKDRTVPGKSYQNFLVVGITENLQMRQIFEEVLAAELRKKGVAATASYTITGVEEKLSRGAVEKAVQATAVDAVITTRVVDFKKKTQKDVGYVMSDRAKIGPVSFATFDLKPVEITTSTTYALETDLFDTATQNLVWTGTTNAVDPQGIITVSKEFSGVVITEMSKEGLIP